KNLERAVRAGTLREDLYFRLSVVTVELPALRQRLPDLPVLAEAILSKVGKRLSPETLAILEGYEWPGNIRELRNVLQTSAQLATGEVIEPGDLVFFSPRRKRKDSSLPLAGKSLEQIEKMAIAQTLQQCGGNKTKAAKALGISPSTLYEKIKRYGL